MWTTLEFWRADQSDRARVDEALSVCGADLDFCRASADSTTTMLRRQLDAAEHTLLETRGLALQAEHAAALREAQLREENAAKWSTASVVAWVIGGTVVGATIGAVVVYASK